MSNKTYDILKVIALVILPLFAAIIIGFGEIWNIEACAPVGATITMVDAAMGVALDKLSKMYHLNEGGEE